MPARLFFALWPPPDVAQALAVWAKRVAGETRGKPVRADQVHLTLVFLGDADPWRAIGAAQRVEGEAFDLPIETARYWKHNRIVWA